MTPKKAATPKTPKIPRTPRSTKRVVKEEVPDSDDDFSTLIGKASSSLGSDYDDEDYEMADATPSKLKGKTPNSSKSTPKGPSMQLKAIKARERALVDKFAVVQSMIGNELEKDEGIVVNTYHHAEAKNAVMDKSYDYTHLMKMVSPMPFVLVKQTMLRDGPYKGHVAILFKQSRPFPFLKLPLSIRNIIYKHLLLHPSSQIPMTMTQGSKKTAYTPEYHGTKRCKNVLAILATCQEVSREAAIVAYGQKFHFPGTQIMTAFLLQIGDFIKYLRWIDSDTYNAASARNMWHLLQFAPGLEHISFVHFSSNERPMTAIKVLYDHAERWFKAVGKVEKAKGLEILSFGDEAFHYREKGEKGDVESVVCWGKGERKEFLAGLKAKLEGKQVRKAPGTPSK